MGRDNTPRVAILKTATGILKRPVQRIFPLEMNNTTSDNDVDNAKDFQEKVDKTPKVHIVKTTESVGHQTIVKNDKTIVPSDQDHVKTRSGRITKKVMPFQGGH